MAPLLGHEEEMAETAVVVGQPSLVSTSRALGRTLKGLARLAAVLEVETLNEGRRHEGPIESEISRPTQCRTLVRHATPISQGPTARLEEVVMA